MIGQTIAHYRVTAKLGAGGMGEVYRATDTKLGREVALKLLPGDLLRDPQALERFQREARAVSALNHPHIVAVFDTGMEDSQHFIVMELVEGVPLSEWIKKEQPELRRVLEVVTQVADALTVAHEAGIIHRDIKPANLLVTPQGYAKVLDFGLAKLTEKRPSQEGATASIERPISKAGAVMGTAAYMSPEQALGREVDGRTDVFSLGGVLYESVTGVRVFGSGSEIDVLHAIVHSAPRPARERNPTAPRELQWLLDKALAKDRDERYQSMREFAADLRRLRRRMESASAVEEGVQIAAPAARPVRIWIWVAGSAAVTFAVLLGLLTIPAVQSRLLRGAGSRAVALHKLTLTQLTTDQGYEGEPTFSLDGETIAYVSDRTGNFDIYLKQVSGGPDINLTNNPADDLQPAFSPDGKQIAFVSSREGATDVLVYYSPRSAPVGGDIWVMSALGGSPRRVARLGNYPSWSPDGSAILYTSGPWTFKKLYRVAAAGGEPQEIPVQLTEAIPPHLLYPRYSADERWIVFEAQETIYVVPATGGVAKLIALGRNPVWTADSSSIIYSSTEPGRNESLWQIPFSIASGEASGPAWPLTVGRGRDTQAAASRDGKRIAFSAQSLSFNLEVLPIDAEAGRVTGEPRALTHGSENATFMDFSPDGKWAVYETKLGRIWKVSTGGGSPIPISVDPRNRDAWPRWSPDGRTIAFFRGPAGRALAWRELWLMAEDGGAPRKVADNASGVSWMPDGRGLTYVNVPERKMMFLHLNAGTTRTILTEQDMGQMAMVSPDGKWVLFPSTAAGNVDLRAVPFEGGESRPVVATPHQDYHPIFSPSGKWLYFHLDHKNLYRVPGPAQGWRQTPPEKLTNFPESGLMIEDPRISRDGKLLLYGHGRLTADIWVMDLPQ